MAGTPKKRSVSLNTETIELLMTIKSCFLFARKKNISYDEIITSFVCEGIKSLDPKVYEIFKLASETASEDNEEQIDPEDKE